MATFGRPDVQSRRSRRRPTDKLSTGLEVLFIIFLHGRTLTTVAATGDNADVSYQYGNDLTRDGDTIDISYQYSNDLTRDGSNATSPIYCTSVHNQSSTRQCEFVQSTKDCGIDGGFINYLYLPYCRINVPGGMIILFLWLLYLFLAIGVTVEHYLCPALSVISNTLGLSESVAGVTFLAFGNGAADIFSLFVLITQGDDDPEKAELAMGAILGGGLFVTSVVVGLISISYPLNVKLVSFGRDIVFYMVAVCWLVVMLNNNQITLGESCGFIVLYVLYVICVIVGLKINKFQQKRHMYTLPDQSDETQPLIGPKGNEVTVAPKEDNETITDTSFSGSIGGASTKMVMEYESMATMKTNADQQTEEKEETAEVDNKEEISAKQKLMKSLWPYEKEAFLKDGWHGKVLTVLRAPVRLALTLTIAVIHLNESSSSKDNTWNYYLIIINVIIGPVFASLALDLFFHEIGELIIAGVVSASVGLVLGVVVALVTSRNKAPSWQAVFSFLGFLLSVVWIYLIANEVVNILATIGVVLSLNGAFLGLIVLAGGNSVCDLVANFLVAKSGKPEMGFAACYGSPLLNMLIGVGFSATLAIANDDKPYKVVFTPQLKVAAGVLLTNLLFIFMFVFVSHFPCRWEVGRFVGVTLILIYVLLLTTEIALEFS